MNLFLTPQALEDIEVLSLYGARQFGVSQAISYADRLWQRLDQLSGIRQDWDQRFLTNLQMNCAI